MQKLVVLLTALCGLLALTQAAVLKSKQAEQLKTCDESKVQKYMDKILVETFDLRAELIADYENLYSGVLACTLSSFAYFKTCIVKTVQSDGKSIKDDVENYYSKIKPLAQELYKHLRECV